MRPFLHPRTLRKFHLVPSSRVPLVMRDLMGTHADDLLWQSYGGLAAPYPPPGQGDTLEHKVGTLLANAWKQLGVVESNGFATEKQEAVVTKNVEYVQTWSHAL